MSEFLHGNTYRESWGNVGGDTEECESYFKGAKFVIKNTREINHKNLRLISRVFLHIIETIRLERGQKLCVKQGR